MHITPMEAATCWLLRLMFMLATVGGPERANTEL